MAKVAVDLDDTLYSFETLARQILGRFADESGDERLRNAAYATWDEWRAPSDLAGPEAWERVIDEAHRSENILAQVPYLGAADTLRELQDMGHKIIYVSNRDPSTRTATSRWLRMNGFPGLDVDVLCHTDDKLALIRDCKYLIDDRPKTLVQFLYAPMGDGVFGGPMRTHRKAFGLVTPYNRGLTDVPGVYLAPNWDLLRRYLRPKIGHPS